MIDKTRFLILSAGLALVGCEGAPCVGDCSTAVITTGADADALVPLFAGTNLGRSVGHQLFLKLADLGMDLNTVGDAGFVPQLAESWSFEDSLTLVFRLHPDARWHDGTPVTAADVAFTFELYTDTLIAAAAGPLLESVREVTARDERTAVVAFTRVYPEQFYDAVYHMYVLPKHLLDSIPRDRLGTHAFLRAPVGDGPYRFVSWRAAETIELAADSTFFRGRPGISRLIWRITPDYTTSVTQLASGDADIIEAVLGRDNIARVAALEHIRLYEHGSNLYAFLGFNLRAAGDSDRPHPLFADRDVRRAMALAIDRDAILGSIFGEWGAIPGGPVTPMMGIWDAERRQLPFDTARARQILTEGGWRDTNGDGIVERGATSLSFTLNYPSSSTVREQAAVIVERQLRAVGIEARLAPLEFNAFVDRSESGRFDALVVMMSADIPPSSIRGLWSSAAIGGLNYGAYSSPPFDSLVALASVARDAARARALWADALAVINDDAPAVWLFTPMRATGVDERFQNVTVRPDEWSATLWTWTVR